MNKSYFKLPKNQYFSSAGPPFKAYMFWSISIWLVAVSRQGVALNCILSEKAIMLNSLTELLST